jgi:predicted nucleic-acid-binding Zn-ribbon protein
MENIYKCPKCGNRSTSEEINEYTVEMYTDIYPMAGIEFPSIDCISVENTDYEYYCPWCDASFLKKRSVKSLEVER